MAEFLNKRHLNNEARDYKERFEFKFTVGDNIICQRYFRINNFNERSLVSAELADTIRECAEIIDKDLKDKTAVYLEFSAPKCFENEEEMDKYFANPANKQAMRLGEGIVVGRGNNAKNYAWGKNDFPVLLKEAFDKGEFNNPLTEEDWQDYKFAFFDNGKEVCSTIWTSCYPRPVRNSIDLSNKKGRCDDKEELSRLSYDRYIQHKMVEGKPDNVWNIIKTICDTCSNEDSWYTTTVDNHDNMAMVKEFKAEIERLKKYEQDYR